MVATLLAVPTVSAQAATPPPTEFFGTWYDGLSPTRAQAAADLDRIHAAGIGTIRQYVFWDRIETSPGTFDWSRTDALFDDLSARGMRILPTLLYTPAFYSSRPEGSTYRAQFRPSDPQTMARFAAVIVKRYGAGGSYWCPIVALQPLCRTPYLPVQTWEVWNEPDYTSWWGGKPDPAEYAPLLKAVAASIRSADPTALVELASLTNAGGSKDNGYLESLYALGARDDFDVLSLNPYAPSVGGMMAYLRGQRAVATRYGDADKPIRITEYGWATGGRSSVNVTTENCQAALLHAATSKLVAVRDELNLQAVTQFRWQDAAQDTTAWPDHAGVLRSDSTDKPAHAALAAGVAGQPAPPGLTLTEACPADQRSTDGTLQALTTAVAGTGTGTLKSSPRGIPCGTDCSAQFLPQTPVTLTAAPAAGSYVRAWGDPSCTGTSCVVTMDQARFVAVTVDADRSAPTVRAAGLPAFTLASSVRFGWSATDEGSGVADYAVRYRRASYDGAFGSPVHPASWQGLTSTSLSVSVPRGETYCLSVQARDHVGNLSSWSAERCTAAALDDRTLATSTSGWIWGTGSGYYAATITSTTRSGGVLTRTGLQSRRLSLVASRCPGCGAVGAYWNGTLIRMIVLNSTTTAHQQLFTITDFGTVKAGTLVIKTLKTGSTRIDGLASSRA